jgi:signal transduction histidine kinase
MAASSSRETVSTSRRVSASARPGRNGGSASGARALSAVRAAARIASEAEERRRLVETNRELARAQRVQSDFIASVSHDLRGPLASIREFIAIVADGLAGALNDPQREYLGIAMRNADALSEMIEHLLVLARIQQGSFRVVRRRVSLPAVLGDDSLLKGARLGRKVVHLRVIVPPALPDIYADPDRLLEVIRNLVDNAIKYSGDAVNITIGASEAPGSMIEISVRDDGAGMDPTAMKSLFRRFYRGKHAGRANPGGLGLGLSIVKEIVDLHSGRIAVESKPEVGSVFRVCIPRFDPKLILTSRLRDAWKKHVGEDGGFGLVQIGVRRCNGLLPRSGAEPLRLIRESLRLVLPPEAEILLDWQTNRRVCILCTGDKETIAATTRKIMRRIGQRLRLHSGIHIEWEKGPRWVHSDDFLNADEMIKTILKERLCKGGPTDA